MAQGEFEVQHREQCLRCFRPLGHCYCALLPTVDNQTPLLIVQHPRERFHPFGTARMLDLGLQRVRVEIDHVGRLQRPGALHFAPGAALLYPGPEARLLDELEPHERPRELVVIDGTWHHAHTLLRDIPDLQTLPCVKLRPTAPSRYRIRAEPRAECLSTVEATLRALQQIEPHTRGFDDLLAAFDRIIDHQIEFIRSSKQGRHVKRVRPAELRKFPRALVGDAHDLVVGYGESLPLGGEQKQLFQWSALRLTTGESFEHLLSPPVISGPHDLGVYLRHMRLDTEQLSRATSPEEFRARWQTFLRPNDVLVVHNQSSLDLLAGQGLLPAQSVVLKAVYFNLGRKFGSLDQIVQREGLTLQPPEVPGRAAERLANAAALTRFLREELCSLG